MNTDKQEFVFAHIENYQSGGPKETAQFDFLIGEWNCKSTAFNPINGSAVLEYSGLWKAKHLFGKRVVYDSFMRLNDKGEEIGAIVTLRTFSATTNQWEMNVIEALKASPFSEFRGSWEDGEMRLRAVMNNMTFRGRIFNIQKNSFLWEGEVSSDNYIWKPFLSISATRTK